MYCKNSAKRDTRPLKGRDLIINVHQGGIPKDHIIEKIGVSEKISLAGNIFLRGWGWVLHPKPECGITQPSSRFALYNVMTSSSSSSISPSTMISLVALVGHWEKVGKSSKQASNQSINILTLWRPLPSGQRS